MEEVTTLAQLNALDQDAIVEGYLHGLQETPNHTRSDQAYWHGYSNARSDRGEQSTPGQQQLAREVVNAMRCGRRAPA